MVTKKDTTEEPEVYVMSLDEFLFRLRGESEPLKTMFANYVRRTRFVPEKATEQVFQTAYKNFKSIPVDKLQ